MGFLSRVEGKVEDTVEGAADRMSGTPLSPVQIAKKAERQMRREKMVGAGKQFAPTLYTVLVNPEDDRRLFGYYPTLAGETETYLSAKASEQGLIMDGQPLVRFIVDDQLKQGKFEVIAELVAAPLVNELRQEEFDRYNMASQRVARGVSYESASAEEYEDYPAQPQPQSQVPGDPYGGQAIDPFAPSNAYIPQENPSADPYAPATQRPVEQVSYEQDTYINPEAAMDAVTPQTIMMDQQAVASANAQAQMPLTAYLYDITNDRAFTLTGTRLRIGRESRNDIVIPDINISRLHAEIRQDASGTWILTDLGSTNGTYVNGRQIKSTPLADADRVVMGTTSLEFQLI